MKTTILAVLVLHASVQADELAVVSPDYSGHFETLDNALYHSLAQALALSGEFEHGGIVVRYNGVYYASIPVNSGSDRGVNFAQNYRGELVATYHTHLCIGDFQARFSPTDIKQAIASKVPSYLGVACTGELRVFNPHTMEASMRSEDKGTSEGRLLRVTFENLPALASRRTASESLN